MFEYKWLELALKTLSDIYVTLDLADQDRMAAGVELFNARLATDPLAVGESRVGAYRVAFPPLLRVYFYVDEVARRVEVTDAIRYGR